MKIKIWLSCLDDNHELLIEVETMAQAYDFVRSDIDKQELPFDTDTWEQTTFGNHTTINYGSNNYLYILERVEDNGIKI